MRTFEEFVNESINEGGDFNIGDTVSILSKSTKKPFDSGKVTKIQKDGNVVVNGTKTFSHEVVVHPDDLIKESIVNEDDLAYWKGYEIDDSPQAEDWMMDKAKTIPEVLKCIDRAIEAWNDEAEDEDGEVSDSIEESIKKLATKFFKKFGYINASIVMAMIAQEG